MHIIASGKTVLFIVAAMCASPAWPNDLSISWGEKSANDAMCDERGTGAHRLLIADSYIIEVECNAEQDGKWRKIVRARPKDAAECSSGTTWDGPPHITHGSLKCVPNTGIKSADRKPQPCKDQTQVKSHQRQNAQEPVALPPGLQGPL